MSTSDVAEKLMLDASKLAWHADRVAAWDRGERIAPITIDMALTQACTAGCGFCVHPDSLIQMADGSSRKMKDVKKGDRITSVDVLDRISVSVVTHHWMTSPSRKTLHLRTLFGSLICTDDHPIRTRRGWLAAKRLKEGQEVAVYVHGPSEKGDFGEDESRQSNASSRSRAAHGGYIEFETRRENSSVVETHVGNRKMEASADEYGGQATGIHSHDARQSDASPGSCSESLANFFAETPGKIVGNDEAKLEDRKDKTPHLWARSEQAGNLAVEDGVSPRLQIHGGRSILDKSNRQWNKEKSGFYYESIGREGGTSFEFVLSSQGQIEVSGGGIGLLECGLDDNCFLAEKQVDPVASWPNHGDFAERIRFVKIESIEPGPATPVFDLECWPHHNFIADGFVVHNCYARLQANKPRKITVQHMRDFLDDCAEIGVKAVSFVSDGESTLSPAYVPSIEYGHSIGIDMASGTWGGTLTREMVDRVLPCLTYLRFNVSGGTPKRTAEIMGISVEQHLKVLDIIRHCVQKREEMALGTTIGIQMVLRPQDGDQIAPFSILALNLGVDYGVIKHCSDDEDGSLGVDYSQYPSLYDELRRAEAMSTEATQIIVKWNKITVGNLRSYKRCYGPPFILQISGTGLVAPCGMLFNDKYKEKFHIGNICESRFRDIWQSERYWEVMRFLSSPAFDAQTMCGSLCLQDLTNRVLDEHVRTGCPVPEPAGGIPQHVNFV